MTDPTARAALARIGQMADYWEQHLPEVIRTPAVVSAIRAALEPAAASAGVAPATDRAAPSSFVLWLDASDGSVPTHDGIAWPDGTATVHHRHFGYTTTHANPEAARQAAHGEQGRIVWPEAAPADQAAVRIRAYLDALPDTANLGAEFAYGRQFRSDGWPHDSYPLTREDVETLLAVSSAGQAPATDRAALRETVAAALVRYDWNAGLSGRDTPSEHHYGEADAVLAVLPATTDQAAELTAEEARALADDLGLQLYRAQDALAFVEECCTIAEREQRAITTADVREWLKGAQCGRQLAAGDAELRRLADETQPGTAELDSYERTTGHLVTCLAVAGGGSDPDCPACQAQPTPLRWGLDDVLYCDDDTTTVLLSGPGGEPYLLELDPERAAALRDSLAGPDEPAAEAAVLTAAERKFLTFALDQAAEEMSLGDGFTDEDQAALEKLRRMADETQPAAGSALLMEAAATADRIADRLRADGYDQRAQGAADVADVHRTAARMADDAPEPRTRQCGHDDYHDAHEWADQPHIWCPGYTTEATAS